MSGVWRIGGRGRNFSVVSNRGKCLWPPSADDGRPLRIADRVNKERFRAPFVKVLAS